MHFASSRTCGCGSPATHELPGSTRGIARWCCTCFDRFTASVVTSCDGRYGCGHPLGAHRDGRCAVPHCDCTRTP